MCWNARISGLSRPLLNRNYGALRTVLKRGITSRGTLLFYSLLLATPLLSAQTVTLSSTSLAFGNVVVGAMSSPKTITVTNSGSAVLNISGISVSSNFSQSNNCAQVATRSKCSISVTFAPTALGSYKGNVTIFDNAGTGVQTVTLTGSGVPPVALSPTSLSLGSVVLGLTSAVKQSTLTNYQSVPLSIAGILVSGPFSLSSGGTCSIQVAAKSTCTVAVSYTATATTSQTGVMTINHDAPNSPSTVNLSGTGTPVKLTSVGVSPSSATMPSGTSLQLTATGYYNNNTTQNLTGSATWSSSQTSIASINKGLATAKSQGNTTVIATSGTLKGSASLSVTGPALMSISVVPGTTTIPLGGAQQFKALGTYTDSSTSDLTTAAAWTSDNPSTVTVSPTGSATGMAQGSSTITASIGALSGTATVDVAPAELVSIQVLPSTASIALGTTQQFSAIGTYSDGGTLNLTQQVTWSSTPQASISNTTGSEGLAQTVAVGSGIVTATLNSVTGSAALTVKPAALISITVSPSAASVAKGLRQQFTAIGTFTDGTTQDVTAGATWTSSLPEVSTISNAPGTQGEATTVGPGSTDITATSNPIVSNTAALTVQSPALVYISISPPNPIVAVDTAQQLSATGLYTDGSTQDLTTSAVWTSSSDTIAMISNSAGTEGVLTAVSVGSATVSTSAGSIIGDNPVTVSPAGIISLVVNPDTATIPLGTNQQFTATATFSDETMQDVTATVHWSTGSGGVALVSNSAPYQGLVTSVAQGSTSITATAGSVSSSAVLTIDAASVVSISVTPPNTAIPVGASQQFSATGLFSDGTTEDLTSTVVWGTSPSSIANISNSIGSQGRAIALAQGTTAVTAAQGGITGSGCLSVGAPTFLALTITPSSSSISIGFTQPFVATATYSDGSTQNVTTLVAWSSSASAVATVSDAGLANGLSSGTTTISSMLGSTVTSAVLTVVAALPVPTDFRVDISVGTTGQLIASWDTMNAATYYNLQRSNNGSGFAIVASCSGPSSNGRTKTFTSTRLCRDSGLAVGATYTYEVQACNANGCSDFSPLVSNVPVFSDCTPQQIPPQDISKPNTSVKIVTSTVDRSVSFLPGAYQYAGYPPAGALRKDILVVTMPGSGGTCGGFGPFAQTALNLGFDVICINYSNAASQNNICVGDPACFGSITQAKFDATGPCSVPNGAHCGKDPNTGQPYVNSNPADAITQRISTMLQYLNNNGYNANGTIWGNYLAGSSPRWDKMIVGGHSQGGDMGTFAAYQHVVAECSIYLGRLRQPR